LSAIEFKRVPWRNNVRINSVASGTPRRAVLRPSASSARAPSKISVLPIVQRRRDRRIPLPSRPRPKQAHPAPIPLAPARSRILVARARATIQAPRSRHGQFPDRRLMQPIRLALLRPRQSVKRAQAPTRLVRPRLRPKGRLMHRPIRLAAPRLPKEFPQTGRRR
jgi:hypothetical protein